jgi:hypothetical protein
MSLRLYLGGTQHGRILETSTEALSVAWAIPESPELMTLPELIHLRYRCEDYAPKKLGLFGRTLTVMVERSVLWNEGQLETWAMEFLISSLARALMTVDGGR